MSVCGPPSWRFMFATKDDIESARRCVSLSASEVSEKEREAAETLLRAVVHPDTGEVIPLPFRMCSHVAVNGCLVYLMVTASSAFGIAATQLANQSFNVRRHPLPLSALHV